jgi:ectoine hydroxylase-related dioxygenase (phytanoyl-CoA dioxygenase family)
MPNKVHDVVGGLKDATDIFREHGVAVVRGAIETELLSSFRQELHELIDVRMETLGRPKTHADLDRAYLALKAVNPALSRELVIAARETLGFYRVLTSPLLTRLVTLALESQALQIVHDCCMMRIDGRDDGREFDWHYDFAYNAMSEHAITCWIPVTQTDGEMGCMRVVPGSHRTIRKVRLMRELTNAPFAGPRKIQLHAPDIEAFERSAIELPSVGPGDVILLHALTLHRSGANETDRARWVVNPRFSDIHDRKVVARGWKVSRAKDPYVFQDLHPELVVPG